MAAVGLIKDLRCFQLSIFISACSPDLNSQNHTVTCFSSKLLGFFLESNDFASTADFASLPHARQELTLSCHNVLYVSRFGKHLSAWQRRRHCLPQQPSFPPGLQHLALCLPGGLCVSR